MAEYLNVSLLINKINCDNVLNILEKDWVPDL